METISFSSRLHSLKARPAAKKQDQASMNQQMECLEHPHIEMGTALMRTPLFQENQLSLYCGVPVRYLLPEGAQPWDEFFDFVVCQGEDAVMTVKLADMDEQVFNQLLEKFWAVFPERFVQLFQGRTFGDGDWVAKNVIAPTIARERRPDGFRVKNPILPVPNKLLKKLAGPSVQALTKETVRGRQYWLPTEYGQSLGLLVGFRTDQNGRVRSMICCGQDAIDGLKEVAFWGEPDSSPPISPPSSLAQRIDWAERGMSAQTDAMMDLIRQQAEMPLEDYLRDDREGLAEFQWAFPNAHTYQEAANSLANYGGDDRCFLDILAGPLIKRTDVPLADKPVRSVLMGASILAKSKYLIWSGEMLFRNHDPKHVAGNWSYRKWLRWADQTIRKSQGDEIDLYGLIYRLVAEPFSLVYQQTTNHCV